MVGSKHIGKLAAKERKELLRRAALRPDEKKSESVEPAMNPTQGSQADDQVGELTKRVRALEDKLEANNKILEANTRELAESTHQVSKLTALLQLFLKGKTKDVAVDVSFPIPNEEALAAFEFKINPRTKDGYIQAITNLLRRNSTLSKSLKSVLAEPLLCDFNLDGVNGKKSLRAFPEFLTILIDSISALEGQLPPLKALAHALSCAKNNANKKKTKINNDSSTPKKIKRKSSQDQDASIFFESDGMFMNV